MYESEVQLIRAQGTEAACILSTDVGKRQFMIVVDENKSWPEVHCITKTSVCNHGVSEPELEHC